MVVYFENARSTSPTPGLGALVQVWTDRQEEGESPDKSFAQIREVKHQLLSIWKWAQYWGDYFIIKLMLLLLLLNLDHDPFFI